MEMIDRAKPFLVDTKTFHDWNMFESNQFSKWISKDWLHSDRWSATYNWVNDGRFENIEIPNDIIKCLVEYWEQMLYTLELVFRRDDKIMQNNKEFSNGFEFCKEEVEKYIERNKEVVSEYTHSAQYIPNEREMIDVEDFLKWLREQ